MDVTRSTSCLCHHLSILPHSHPQASYEECRSWARGIWADPRKAPTIIRWHQPSLDGCQAGPAQVLGTKGIPIISPSPVCIVYSCKLLLLGLPWEQLWVPSGCTELNFSWGSSFHLHGQPSAHPTKSGSMSGERLLVHCVRGWCTASPKQRLINECLHSTSKVWRAI